MFMSSFMSQSLSVPSLGFGLGAPELLLILLLVLVLFGSTKLPQIGAGLGKSIKDFKKAMKEEDDPSPAASGKPAVVQVEVQRPDAIESDASVQASATQTKSETPADA